MMILYQSQKSILRNSRWRLVAILETPNGIEIKNDTDENIVIEIENDK